MCRQFSKDNRVNTHCVVVSWHNKKSIPASKLPYGATGLSEGETFITNISKVPAVEQIILASNFLSNRDVAVAIFSLSPYDSYSVCSFLPRQTFVRSEMAPDALVCTG